MGTTERSTETRSTGKTVRVDGNTVPWLAKGKQFDMRVANFPDHGRPCFIGSAIQSNNVALELAQGLNEEESKRGNKAIAVEIESILNGDGAKRAGINRLSAGEPYDPRGLVIYYHRGEHLGTPLITVLAKSRLRDEGKVEKVLGLTGDGDRRRRH